MKIEIIKELGAGISEDIFFNIYIDGKFTQSACTIERAENCIKLFKERLYFKREVVSTEIISDPVI